MFGECKKNRILNLYKSTGRKKYGESLGEFEDKKEEETTV